MNKVKEFLKKNYYFFILIFILFLIFFCFPYMHDDWAWGSRLGLERLKDLFRNYNGRWAGNILVILLTRSNILKTIVMLFTFIFTVKLINLNNSKYDRKNPYIIYLTIFLLLVIPVPIIRQTISWTSGFTNYCIPVPIILFIIYQNKNIFSFKKYSLSNKLIIINLLLGFIVSLFMEHVTIYNLLLSITIIIFDKKINKKVNIANIMYLLGSILGTFLLFSNEAYVSIFNGVDTYRTIGKENIISTIINTYFDELSFYTVSMNKILNIVISILLLLLFKKNKSKIPYLDVCKYMIILFMSYNIFGLFNSRFIINKSLFKLFEGCLTGLICISSFFTIIFKVDKKEVRYKLVFYLLSIIVLIVPLTVVTPIGPRCFYITYIFFILFISELYSYLDIDNKYLFDILKYVNVILLLFYLIIFSQVYFKDKKRREIILEYKETNATKMYLPSLPYEEYLWNPNPRSNSFIRKFKLFYGIDEDVVLVFVKE